MSVGDDCCYEWFCTKVRDTYDKQNGAAADQVALEALLNNPTASMHVERSEDLRICALELHGLNVVWACNITSSKSRMSAEE